MIDRSSWRGATTPCVSLRADQSVTFRRRHTGQRTGKLPVRSYHGPRGSVRLANLNDNPLSRRRRRSYFAWERRGANQPVSLPSPSLFLLILVAVRRRRWHFDERQPGTVFRNTMPYDTWRRESLDRDGSAIEDEARDRGGRCGRERETYTLARYSRTRYAYNDTNGVRLPLT